MGGCKCTYRNCRVKSDGKTHMFHYPVFEKVRCHQWLINAQRLDFLNLKVSQVKNRVVCQHHFKDECFMNFRKDKLTFDAIPTEDGPFCDSTNYVDTSQESNRLYTIVVDDIENDEYLLGSEKKTNLSMKYGDFLTNFDLMDIENKEESNVNQKQNNSNILEFYATGAVDRGKLTIDEEGFLYKLTLPDKGGKKGQTQPMLVVPPYMNSRYTNKVDNFKNRQKFDVSNVSVNSAENNLSNSEVVRNEPVPQKIKKPPKITIISEKKITNPLPITGKFATVSPNFVLNVPKTKRNSIPSCLSDSIKIDNTPNYVNNYYEPVISKKIDESISIKIDTKPDNNKINDKPGNLKNVNIPDTVENFTNINNTKNCNKHKNSDLQLEIEVPNMNAVQKRTCEQTEIEVKQINDDTKDKNSNELIEIDIKHDIKEELPAQLPPKNPIQNNIVFEKSPTTSILKSRVPPERAEAINKKRKFNMKLREVIETCLDKLESPDKAVETRSPVKAIKTKNIIKPSKNITREAPVHPNQDYTIAFLEARMKKMENTLLEKIEENSRKIVDLKNAYVKSNTDKKPTIPTKNVEQARKKQLFQEISKYLSPSSKSLIYEELFINKFSVGDPRTSTKRKRGSYGT